MVVYGILAVISFISPMMKNSTITKEIDKSFICKTMYENNIILKIIL